MAADPIAALMEVVKCLDEIGLPYAIGGSVASSVHGEPRASADADLLVELAEHQLPDLVAGLQGTFYVPDDAAREAIRRAASFNVIHVDSAYKVDILDWFRRGGGVSDLQWRDVLGVLKVQGPALDVAYLRDIARQVGLEQLLDRAMSEAGLGPG